MFRLASAMLKLRKAVPDDIPLILSFIRELAEYERAPNAVSCTENDLRAWPFSSTTTLRGKDDLESSSKICSCDPSFEARASVEHLWRVLRRLRLPSSAMACDGKSLTGISPR